MALTEPGTWEREVLRHDARANWQRAQELTRSVDLALSCSDRLTASSVAFLAESQTRRALAANVERAISQWSEHLRDGKDDKGPVAVVASSDMEELLRVLRLATGRLVNTIGVSDAGTVLGFAIAAQPDIAIIDAHLELGSGVDTALTLPIYAPRTRVLVLTDDPEQAGDVRTVGLDTELRRVSDRALAAWIGDWVA